MKGETIIMDEEKEKGFLARLGQRVNYFINPSKIDQRITKEVNTSLETINKELAPYSKGLVYGGQGSSNFVLYDVVSSRGGFGQKGFAYTETRLMMDFFYTYGVNHATLMAIITALMGEVFRNGLGVKPLFESKCESCGATFENLMEECPACKSKEIIEPDIKMRERIEQEIISVFNIDAQNENRQTILDVTKELFLDLSILDVEYGLIAYRYELDPSGYPAIENTEEYLEQLNTKDEIDPIPKKEYESFQRVHPALIRPVIEGDVVGYGYTCIKHRKVFSETRGLCSEQGCYFPLFPITHARFRPETEEVAAYYIKGEIIQSSKTFPNPIGGVPNVRFLYKPLELINVQLDHLLAFYTLKRNPNGIIWVKHRNAEDLKEFWNDQMEEIRNNPHHIPMIQVDPDTSGDSIGYLSVDNTPQEMNFVPTREEATRTVAAFYGVSPIFLNDASTGGGLNSEGLQITVTNRAVAVNQEFINKKIFIPLIRAMGITDFTLILNPSEEQDQKTELELEILKNEIALGWQTLGYDYERDEAGNWILGEKKEVEELTDPFAQALREEDNGKGSAEDQKPQEEEKPVKPHSSAPKKPKHEVSI